MAKHPPSERITGVALSLLVTPLVGAVLGTIVASAGHHGDAARLRGGTEVGAIAGALAGVVLARVAWRDLR